VNARSAIILFAHGARDAQWAQPFERIRALVANALPGIAVELAFLERMTPDLPTAVARVAQIGATRVTVVPLFLGAGGHVKEDVAALVRGLEQQHRVLRFRVTAPIGEDDELVAAIAQWVVRQQRA
jgi:sirohydrochlorin cobaltochelatase